jgi:hypothetical protein
MNLKDLIRLGFLEIFDQFNYATSNIYMFYLFDFLQQKGMSNFKQSSEYTNIFFSFLYSFSKMELYNTFSPRVDENFVNYLHQIIDQYRSKSGLDDFLDIFHKVYSHNSDINTRRRRCILDYVEIVETQAEEKLDEHTAKFLEVYFYDQKRGFQNTLELFEKIPQIKSTYQKKTKVLKIYGEDKPLAFLNLIEKIFVK